LKVVADIDDDDEENSFSDANSNEGIASASKCLNIFFYASILGGKIDKEVDELATTSSLKIRNKTRKGSDLLGLSLFTGILDLLICCLLIDQGLSIKYVCSEEC